MPYIGVIANDRSFAKGVVVTASTFTSEAIDFAAQVGNLELIDGLRLARFITDVQWTI